MLTRAAASSIASGRPSRRTQISVTVRAFSCVSAKAGRTALARRTKSATAPKFSNSSSEIVRPISGTESGRSGYSCSAPTRSRSRLVTSNVSPGQIVRISASSGPAPITCSRLSSASTITRSCRAAPRWAMGARSPASCNPSARAISGSTRAGSRTETREMNPAPSENLGSSSDRICRARRVLPTPPGPVMVTRGMSGRWSSAQSSPISRSRPIRGVRSTGTPTEPAGDSVVAMCRLRCLISPSIMAITSMWGGYAHVNHQVACSPNVPRTWRRSDA